MERSGSIISARVRAGAGLRPVHLPDGTVILEADSGGQAAAPSPKMPFRVAVRSIDGTPSYRVGIGTINLLVPTGVRTWTALTGSPQYVVIDVTTDGSQVTAASIGSVVEQPGPPGCVLGAGPTSFSVPIAYVGPSDSMFVDQIVDDNLVAQRVFCHQTLRDPIPAGATPWVNWWTFAVGTKLNPQLVDL